MQLVTLHVGTREGVRLYLLLPLRGQSIEGARSNLSAEGGKSLVLAFTKCSVVDVTGADRSDPAPRVLSAVFLVCLLSSVVCVLRRCSYNAYYTNYSGIRSTAGVVLKQ